jgi:hypothetical protein
MDFIDKTGIDDHANKLTDFQKTTVLRAAHEDNVNTAHPLTITEFHSWNKYVQKIKRSRNNNLANTTIIISPPPGAPFLPPLHVLLFFTGLPASLHPVAPSILNYTVHFQNPISIHPLVQHAAESTPLYRQTANN